MSFPSHCRRKHALLKSSLCLLLLMEQSHVLRTQLRIPGENPKSNILFMDVKEHGYASKQKQQDG